MCQRLWRFWRKAARPPVKQIRANNLPPDANDALLRVMALQAQGQALLNLRRPVQAGAAFQEGLFLPRRLPTTRLEQYFIYIIHILCMFCTKCTYGTTALRPQSAADAEYAGRPPHRVLQSPSWAWKRRAAGNAASSV